MPTGCGYDVCNQVLHKKKVKRIVKILFYWQYCIAQVSNFSQYNLLYTLTATCVHTTTSCLDQCFILGTSIPTSPPALFQYIFHTAE